MAQGPPSSDSESDDDVCRYQYESEGEERLGASACNLLNEAGGDYRLARASLLAYTRDDLVYVPCDSRDKRRKPEHARERSRSTPPLQPQPVLRGQSMPVAETPRSAGRDSRPVGGVLRPTNEGSGSTDTTVSAALPTPPSTIPAPASTSRDRPRGGVTTTSTPIPVSRDRSLREVASTPVPPTWRNRSRGEGTTQPAVNTQPLTKGRRNNTFDYPRHQFTTLIYTPLANTRMLGYFNTDSGVSRRTADQVNHMLLQIQANSSWVGDMSYVDTDTVASIEGQYVHNPDESVESDSWHLVTAGTQVGIFTSWAEVAPLTQGVSHSIYRSWTQRWKAYRDFQHALILGTVRLLPPPY